MKEDAQVNPELTPADRVASMLEAMWKRSRPQVMERLDLLERAAAALAGGTLTAHERAEAHSTAHKLAGILGTFGFPHGTDLARQLEQDFEGAPDPGRVQEQLASLRELLAPTVA